MTIELPKADKLEARAKITVAVTNRITLKLLLLWEYVTLQGSPQEPHCSVSDDTLGRERC